MSLGMYVTKENLFLREPTVMSVIGSKMQALKDPTSEAYREARRRHWDAVAVEGRPETGMRGCYHRRLAKVYDFLIGPGARVLEIGCAEGNLLAALNPSFGVGVDFSPAMLSLARSRHPELHFVEADAHSLIPDLAPELFDKTFDAIILSDLANDAWNVLELFRRLICNFHSHLWEHPFRLLQKSGAVTPRLQQNWLTPDDLAGLFALAGFEVVRVFDEFLWPFATPVLAPLCNRWLAKIWPFKMLDLTHFMVCRQLGTPSNELTVSVVIPARNEAGNIEAALQRTPEMGAGTEIIFVEGNSTDNTWQTIQDMAQKYNYRKIKTIRQPGRGKGDAVRAGFDVAFANGTAEFVNGVRLIYPQEKEAMRFFNLLGNKFFSLAFSWLLNQKIKDTLCGTKVISKENYRKLAANRKYFGEFDPFGDFDLLFGAAKLNLKIMDLPVRYRERTYGETNISRWRDGWILLKMASFAAGRIKFAP